MQSRLAWFVAGVGVAAAAAARMFRREPVASPGPVVEPDDRADELRRRIAEAKPLTEERDEFEAGETPVDEADPEARRRAVHDRGREELDRMRGRERPDQP